MEKEEQIDPKVFFDLKCLGKDESLNLSEDGLKRLNEIYDPEYPEKHILWTNDYEVELPIRMSKEGTNSRAPYTLIDSFQNAVRNFSDNVALSVKRKGQWVQWTYKDYYRDSIRFGKTLLALKITQMKAINIIGFNAPEWAISFYGAIMANILPVGIYTSNTAESCFYITDHSEAEVLIADNVIQLNKYLKIWDRLPNLKYIVIYNEKINYKDIPKPRRRFVKTFKDFLNLYRFTKDFTQVKLSEMIVHRMKKQKPGNCCTLVYTSGTTGMPKGVMLSHDNYTWTSEQVCAEYNTFAGKERFVSFLPLSHVACQMQDLVGAVFCASQVWYADETALKGSLVETLKTVRPTIFFSVPRVWEKMQEKMKTMAAKKGKIVKWMGNWAKGLGAQGTLAQIQGKSVPWGWWMADTLVYGTVKSKLGLDYARYYIYGASQLVPSVRQYFLSLNIFLINAYGMSETSGPHTIHFPKNKAFNVRSAGEPMKGCEIKIFKPDGNGIGEICMRGRNRFMGYYKRDKETLKAIDKEGWLHSGDLGKIEDSGELTITGRIKELLITAGGENIAPILIEHILIEKMPFIDKAIVVGDFQKYISVLLTLKVEVNDDGVPTDKLTEMAVNCLIQEGCTDITTIDEATTSLKLQSLITAKIKEANKLGVSQTAGVKKWRIIPISFSVQGGELTPTLKLKRSFVHKKWENVIREIYAEAWQQH